MVVEYTKEERKLIDGCMAFFRAKTFPDYQLDRDDPDTILEAIDFAHDKGQVIPPTNTYAHEIMRSIERKCGREVEEPEERQKRLARERYEKRHNIILEAKKKEAEEKLEELKEKETEVKELEIQLAQAKAEDEGVAKAVAEAQKEKLEAEQKAKEAEAEIARLKAQLEQEKQKAKELTNAKDVIEELAKGEGAEVIENAKPSEEKNLEKKSIAELVDELTKPE